LIEQTFTEMTSPCIWFWKKAYPFEGMMDHQVREAFFPGCVDHYKFAVQMGQDAVIIHPIFKKEKITDNRWRSEGEM